MRIPPFAAAALLAAAACSDRLPTDAAVPPPAAPPAEAVLRCTGRVSDASFSCAPAGPSAGGASLNLVIGGQGWNVRLASANVAYDSAAGIFSADVTVQNLLSQSMGTPDGSTVYGVNVFFASTPAVTAGTGTVEVENADGWDGAFTGSGQPYFHYPQVLTPRGTSAPRTWRFSLPPSAESFSFTVYVETKLGAETGVLRWRMMSGAVATDRTLYAVTGTGAGNVFAVGGTTLVHRDADAWARMSFTSSGAGASAAWAHAPDRVFLAGAGGAVWRYDGNRWTALTVGAAVNLVDVWSAGPDTVLAPAIERNAAGVDELSVFRSADGGGTWARTRLAHATSRTVGAVHGAPGGAVYVAGSQENGVTGRDEGLVLRSADGGATWTESILAHPRDRSLVDVWSTGDTVFAVGSQVNPTTYRTEAILLRSVDAGATWAVTVSPHAFARVLQAVWAAGPDTVFVAGWQESAPSVYVPLVLRSTDGGATWAESLPDAPGVRLEDVWGASGREVYATGTGGALLRWDGAAWTREQMDGPRTLTAAAALGRDTLLVAGYRLDDATGVADGLILRSTDAGRSWSPWTRTGADTRLRGAWAAGGTMVVVGTTRSAGATATAGLVARSTDGGATWSETALPHAGTRTLAGVSGTRGDTVFAVGAQVNPVSAVMEGLILRSTDGGATWTPSPSTHTEERHLTGVRGFPDGRVVAVGWQRLGGGLRQGIVLRSADGGETWTVTATSHSQSRLLYGVWGTSADTLFAAGDQTSASNGTPEGVVLHSTDGGGTWTPRTLPGRPLYGIAGLSATHVYAAGSNGTVALWDGASWKVYAPATSARLGGVDAAAGRVWAVGEWGTVLRGTR